MLVSGSPSGVEAQEAPAAAPPPVLAADQVSRQPAERSPLAAGQDATGSLASGDGTLTDETWFDVWELAGVRGRLARLTLAADGFDPLLVLVDPAGRIVAHNDDANPKEGPAAALAVYLAESGTYQVWVNSSGPGEGGYTLRLDLEDHSEPGRVLRAGETASGWLTPADAPSAAGGVEDVWTFRLDRPVLVVLRSYAFDTQLEARAPGGRRLDWNDDLDPIAGDHDSRLLVAPGKDLPAGTEISLAVRLPQGAAGWGRYELSAEPLPAVPTTRGEVRIRPVLVRGAGGQGGSSTTPEQVLAALERARQVWSACGLDLVLDGGTVRTTEIAGLEGEVKVRSGDWTPQELLLQASPLHTGPEDGVITVFIVASAEGGEQHGLSYPATRYASGRTGAVMADSGFTKHPLTLAHEVGHMLGLGHTEDGDGDPWNDAASNLMNAQAGEFSTNGELDPFQCLVGRAAPHYVRGEGMVPEAFRRTDRVLQPGGRIAGTLGGADATLDEGQYLDVYYFRGTAGERVRIEVSSGDLDAAFLVDGPDGERLAQVDDGGAGRDAAAELALPATGDYAVGVTSAFPGNGRYELRLERAAAAGPGKP